MANEDTPKNASTDAEAPEKASASKPPEAAAAEQGSDAGHDHDHAGHDHDHAGHDHAGHDHAGHDHAGHDHAGHGAPAAAADDHDHGLAHTMPIWMLVGVLAALMALTVLTVSVTSYDLGSQGNLVVGMVIATIKAGLVITFFMHILWDKKFHLILLLTSVLFVVLFLSMSVTDRSEYQQNIDLYQSVTSAPAK